MGVLLGERGFVIGGIFCPVLYEKTLLEGDQLKTVSNLLSG